jgi:hypothetical protein
MESNKTFSEKAQGARNASDEPMHLGKGRRRCTSDQEDR